MGYTHYWRKRGAWPRDKVEAAVRDMAEIIRRCEIALADWAGDPETQPYLTETSVRFNGLDMTRKGGEDMSHETFSFPPSKDREDFSFTKTEAKPYDAVVRACLIAAKHHLGAAIEVSSDGDWEPDWTKAPTWSAFGYHATTEQYSGVAIYERVFPDRKPVRNILRKEDRRAA